MNLDDSVLEDVEQVWEAVYDREVTGDVEFLYEDSPVSGEYSDSPEGFGATGRQDVQYPMGEDDSAFVGIQNPDAQTEYIVFELVPDNQVKDSSVRKAVESTAYRMDAPENELSLDSLSEELTEQVSEDEADFVNSGSHLYWNNSAVRSPHRQEFPAFMQETLENEFSE